MVILKQYKNEIKVKTHLNQKNHFTIVFQFIGPKGNSHFSNIQTNSTLLSIIEIETKVSDLIVSSYKASIQ